MASSALYKTLHMHVKNVQKVADKLTDELGDVAAAAKSGSRSEYYTAADRLEADMKGLQNLTNALGQAIAQAEAHIATYANDKQWKKLKNNLLPDVNKNRDRLKAEVTKAKQLRTHLEQVTGGSKKELNLAKMLKEYYPASYA
jgi:hypothetical protein